MATSQRIRLRDFRRMLELVHEIIECGQDPAVWRPLTLEGLKQLLDAQVGLTVDMKIMPDGMPVMIDPIDVGWHTESVRRRFAQYLRSGEMASDPGTLALLEAQAKCRHLCMTRRQLVDDRTWYRAPSVSEARKMGDVDDFVVTTMRLRPDALHGFILYRPWSDKPFETRERRLLKIFHIELARAAAAASRKNASVDPQNTAAPLDVTRLSPRLRQTLDLLLTPLSLKQIAARLGLSRHTVNDYQKALYTRFGVSTRVELIHRYQTASAQRQSGLRLPDALLTPTPTPKNHPLV